MRRFLTFTLAMATLLAAAASPPAAGKKKETRNLRVLYWNIQNGVWADQENNYDNFVEWVRSKNPDICVWCEGATIFYPGTTEVIKDSSLLYLPDGWGELAARYGHKYTWKSGQRDNYPQIITSKYPIESVLRSIGNEADSVVNHGFGHARVNVDGIDLNIVTLHLRPFNYSTIETPELKKYRLIREAAQLKYETALNEGETDSTTLDSLKAEMERTREEHRAVRKATRDISAKNYEGAKLRRMEMEYILRHTVLREGADPNGNWIMLGDFNSRSFKDNFIYKYGNASLDFLVTQYIDSACPWMYDLVSEVYPGIFSPSMHSKSRIDYMYVSRPMLRAAKNVDPNPSGLPKGVHTGLSNFWIPSDHIPIMVDFNLNKLK